MNFEIGKWYFCSGTGNWSNCDPHSYRTSSGVQKAVEPGQALYCERIWAEKPERGGMAECPRGSGFFTWWLDSWDIHEVPGPGHYSWVADTVWQWAEDGSVVPLSAKQEDEMARAISNGEAHDTAAESNRAVLVEDNLENSSDLWDVDGVAQVVNDAVEQMHERVLALDTELTLVRRSHKRLQTSYEAQLSQGGKRSMEQAGRIDALQTKLEDLTAHPDPGNPPFLWNRITGEGPFIEVPCPPYEAERGYICVYAGESLRGTKISMAKRNYWREALTTKKPTTKPLGLGRKIFYTGLLATMGGFAGIGISQLLFPLIIG